ncbi:hypothetical protein ACFQ0B_66885 [Nonomuraea thailandensis]
MLAALAPLAVPAVIFGLATLQGDASWDLLGNLALTGLAIYTLAGLAWLIFRRARGGDESGGSSGADIGGGNGGW